MALVLYLHKTQSKCIIDTP